MKKTIVAIALLAAGLTGCAASLEPAGSTQASSSAVPLVIPDSIADAMAANKATHEADDDLVWDAQAEIPVTLADGASAGEGVEVEGNQVKITKPGNYRISGTLSDGQLVVDTEQAGVVRLIFDGVSITNSTSSALLIQSADKVVLWLDEGSENSLTDAETYVYADGETEPDAALFSKVDLTIAGTGTLNVTGRAGDGITSKDGLVVESGNISVTAADDAVKGRDYLVVRGGTLAIDAKGDALKSTNDSDDTAGYVLVSGGTVKAEAGSDCFDAVTDALVSGGELALSCGDDGIHADRTLMIEDGSVDISKSYEGLESAAVILGGGTINVVASDDGINASNSTGDSSAQEPGGWGSEMPSEMPSGWDGEMPGGTDATPGPMGGNPTAAPPTDMDGKMPGRGSEDGSNTGFGGQGGGPGGGMGGEEAQDAAVIIKGGKITIKAGGDGIDSNGYGTVTGGEIVLDVENRGMEGPIDIVGDWTVTGGTITDPEGNAIQ